MDSLEEPWGLLVVKEGGEDERIPVIGHEFVIGRAKGTYDNDAHKHTAFTMYI